MKKKSSIILLLISVLFLNSNAQEDSLLLTYEQFLQQVYSNHPIAKQINIKRAQATEYLKKAKGSFDPQLNSDWAYKNFGTKNYYNILNAHLKVPVWSSVSIEAGYNYTDGYYLNPENKLPDAGQAYLGLNLSLLKGLWTDERRTAIDQSKVMIQASESEIRVLLNDLLYKAAKTYWDWTKVYNESLIIRTSLENAKAQLDAIRQAHQYGDKPAIDTLKAFIRVQDRQISLGLKITEMQNAARTLSTFLWSNRQTPLEVGNDMYPVVLQELITQALDKTELENSLSQIQDHPNIQIYDFKLENLNIERRLKRNKLLPKLDFKYNFIASDHVNFFEGVSNASPINNYKLGFKFSMPIFIRKERAELKLTKLKQQAVSYQQAYKKVELKVKIENYFNDVQTYAQQTSNVLQMVNNYALLLEAEQLKLNIGESSVFMLNTRENQLLDARLKLVKQQITYLKSKTAYFWITANLQTSTKY